MSINTYTANIQTSTKETNGTQITDHNYNKVSAGIANGQLLLLDRWATAFILSILTTLQHL